MQNAPRQLRAVSFPAELRLGLHGEHGAVVGLHHPGGEATVGEHPGRREVLDKA